MVSGSGLMALATCAARSSILLTSPLKRTLSERPLGSEAVLRKGVAQLRESRCGVDAMYAGSYIIVVVLGVLATALFGLLKAPPREELAAMSAEHDSRETRTLIEIVRQPVFIAAVLEWSRSEPVLVVCFANDCHGWCGGGGS